MSGTPHSDYDRALETWGWYSVPPKAARELRLGEFVARLPVGGVLLDVGAGSGISIGAAAFAVRQDIDITSVDPGFELEGMSEGDIRHAITYFNSREQALLRSTDVWHAKRLSGYAEALPVEDSSVDLLTSYSAVPLYSPDASAQIVEECSRVLKAGSVALHGPMPEPVFAVWQEAAVAALQAGRLNDFSARIEEIEAADSRLVEVHFTEIVR